MAPTNATATSIPFLNALVHLGSVLTRLDKDVDHPVSVNSPSLQKLQTAVAQATSRNPWFTEGNCRIALSWWGRCLTEQEITRWLQPYGKAHSQPARIALILAGNIPLVGFHDLLSVLVTGHTAILKLSSKDNVLIPTLLDIMAEVDESIRSKVIIAEERLSDYDGVIATGSTNTSRYFEYYFGQKPHIIRKNRNAVAVITGEETEKDLKGLADDMFLYFGLGCRNVSKIYVPKDYTLDRLIVAADSFRHLKDHHKFANNYDYHKAIYLMGSQAFIDGKFCLFLESQKIASPIATIHYETYESHKALVRHLAEVSEQIQCIVSRSGIPGELDFGQAQKPDLSKYADGVDTVEFLLKTSFK